MTPQAMTNEDFINAEFNVITPVRPETRDQIFAYGNPINMIHDPGFYSDLVSALS